MTLRAVATCLSLEAPSKGAAADLLEKKYGSKPTPRMPLAVRAMNWRREKSSARRKEEFIGSLFDEDESLRVEERVDEVLHRIEAAGLRLVPDLALPVGGLARQQGEIGGVEPGLGIGLAVDGE